MRSAFGALLFVVAAVTGCGGDDAVALPLVDRIDDAVAAVETSYGSPQDYFQISAGRQEVEVVVATADGGAQRIVWKPDAELAEAVTIDVPFVESFRAADIDMDEGRVLSRVADELPGSEIVDVAITAAGGRPVYDAQVRSPAGGTLFVLLSADGQVLGVQNS